METRAHELEREAGRVRHNILRLIRAGKAGHVGGAMSAADLVTAPTSRS